MRDVKVKLVGATGIVSQPITFERVNDLLHRLEGAIILAERERKRKL